VRSATPTNSASASGLNDTPAVSPKWSSVCTSGQGPTPVP
jgi:hypothetical protein